MSSYEDYAGLGETGFGGAREPVKPEDEFFHSVYIAGQTRINHINKEELAGKLQIRGVEYNKDSVCFIITHIKEVLVKEEKDNQGRMRTACFSFKEGDAPWYGTNQNHRCGSNSAERAANPHCEPCRAQIIVAGIYCTENGKPILNEDKSPTFVFIRGKGMKYSNVSDYLGWLLNVNKVSQKEHDSLQGMIKSDDNENFVLAIEIMQTKKSNQNGNNIHSRNA